MLPQANSRHILPLAESGLESARLALSCHRRYQYIPSRTTWSCKEQRRKLPSDLEFSFSLPRLTCVATDLPIPTSDLRPPTSTMSPNILIVRLSAVGDAIHGLPVLCALRDFFPRARLILGCRGASGGRAPRPSGARSLDHRAARLASSPGGRVAVAAGLAPSAAGDRHRPARPDEERRRRLALRRHRADRICSAGRARVEPNC